MKLRFIFFLFFLLFSISNFSQIKNFEKIDNYVKNTPNSVTIDIKSLAKYLGKNATTKREIISRIYIWIAENIDYDWDAFINNKQIDVSAEITLKNKKSVCSGYSNLFKALCDEIKIKCVIIEGYAKGFGYRGELLKEPNHAWNAVKLYDRWELIDVTWGSGYVEIDGNLEKTLTLRYLFEDPNDFILEHFPTNVEWQLQKNKIDINTFFNTEMEDKRKLKNGETSD